MNFPGVNMRQLLQLSIQVPGSFLSFGSYYVGKHSQLYIGETGRRLGDRFREHLRDVEKNDKDASKPVARHFIINLPNHSKKHMAICGLSIHLGTTESRKNLEQKFIFQIGTLNPHGINERFSFN